MFKMNQAILLTTLFIYATSASAQMTSRGPGKGPPSPGMGSKYTYPQPPKSTPAGPELINPASQIPDHPEKYAWKLSNKNFATGANLDDVPVYTFRELGSGRTLVGQAKVGEEIILEEVRVAMGRNHYKFKWNGTPKADPKSVKEPEFWVDGVNIELAGKK